LNIAITGEKGFIAQNLITEITRRGHKFISLLSVDILPYKNKKGEPCVYRNNKSLWSRTFKEKNIDVVIHNAAVVGTDVVALNSKKAVNTNLLGTQNITEAANEAGILNVYIGTTVIYDTPRYQDSLIYENSVINPSTHYAVQKYAGEMTVKNSAKEWLVLRPLFAYGGVGDPNSLIAKTIYSVKNNIKNVDMFLDPEKMKDYMHVFTFCDAIVSAIESNERNNDFNVSVESPKKTSEIIQEISIQLNKKIDVLNWHPQTDYLGNHLLSCEKFRSKIGFSREPITLQEGIALSIAGIENDITDYNPLVYLEEARNKNVDLLSYFPKK